MYLEQNYSLKGLMTKENFNRANRTVKNYRIVPSFQCIPIGSNYTNPATLKYKEIEEIYQTELVDHYGYFWVGIHHLNKLFWLSDMRRLFWRC